MSLSCGIVGLPNVGKSTVFNAITRAGAQSANYPFCTIEPNLGRVDVPDERLTQIADRVKPRRTIAAATEFVDIAGLVEGASQGEGLGNQFLSHIRETQAIAHVVRCFADDNVVHVRGRVEPEDDIAIIHTELALADLESLTRQVEKLSKKVRSASSGEKDARERLSLGEKLLTALEQGEPARKVKISAQEKKLARSFQLITERPLFYVCNIDEAGIANGNDYTEKVKALAQKEEVPMLQICGKIEEELAVLSGPEQKEYLKSLSLKEPGLNRMIRISYEILDLITFFTAGEEEVRAWTVRKNSLAPQAAGEIHSDMERGFIRAEVTSYADFIEAGSLAAARENGKMRLEGKEYMIRDGNIVHFRFNA